jgi:hypothetical protein
MKKNIIILTLMASLSALIGCSPSYEYDGLYNEGAFISSDHSVGFCTVVKKERGEVSMIWLFKQARRNAAILANLSEVKSINIDDLMTFTLKYPITGNVMFSIGTDIASWKKMGYSPFGEPCNNNDDILNFIHHINLPFSKKSKDGLTLLEMNKKAFEQTKEYLNEYKDVSIYGLVWEAVAGRKVDKGWVFTIDR